MGVNLRTALAASRDPSKRGGGAQVWSGDDVRYRRDVKFPPVKLGPKPVQKPAAPILPRRARPKYAALKKCRALRPTMVPGRPHPRGGRVHSGQIKGLEKSSAGPEPARILGASGAEGPSACDEAITAMRA